MARKDKLDGTVHAHRRNGLRITMRAIGVVRNELIAGQAPARSLSQDSRIVLDAIWADGLTGLEEGGRLNVLFALQGDDGRLLLLQYPQGDKNRASRGVFALRCPRRPNPIGLTTVVLLRREGCSLHVRGLDAWEGTLVLDIKPFAPFMMNERGRGSVILGLGAPKAVCSSGHPGLYSGQLRGKIAPNRTD